MIARVATFHQEPTDSRDWVVDALTAVLGVHSVYHLRDQTTGAMLSISFLDDEEGACAAVEAVGARAREIGHTGPGPDEIRTYDVVRSIENRATSG